MTGEQRPSGIYQRDSRSTNVTFKLLSDQRATHDAMTATGSSAGDAASIVRDLTLVEAGSGGVQLPGALKGRQVRIRNQTGVTITVYPESTDAVDGTTATGVTMSNATTLTATAFKNNHWYTG